MNTENITVGFLTAKDPRDKRAWSGTIYRMFDALEHQSINVIPLGPVEKPVFIKALLLVIDILHRVFFRKRFNRHHNQILSKYFAFCMRKKLQNNNIDVIFAPAASSEIAFLKTDIPICYLSDSSFGQLAGYYHNYSDLSERSMVESNLIEQLAIDKSAAQVYPSQWAADYVIRHYGANLEKVHVVPFGANVDSIPSHSDIEQRDYSGHIKLLFLGVEWERKGGDIALDALNELLSQGYDVSLTVCGCTPPVTHERMNVIPFLNKNIPAENEVFMNLLLECHLLFIPTRAECFGIVFSEAGAFGLPVVSTDTGGVSSVVIQGLNGVLLPLEAQGVAYAEQISALIGDREALAQMSLKSREMFEETFNWRAWAATVKDVLIGIKSK